MEPYGYLLTELIPPWELIIGRQTPMQEDSFETRNRFYFVLQSLIRAIARKERPLVIFIDNLQWADEVTLNFLELLMNNPENRFLLFMGAYRDNELPPEHPLFKNREGMPLPGVLLSLKDIRREDLNRFISDILQSPETESRPFSEAVFEKAGGNPFFVIQFLHLLHREEILRFNYDVPAWEWNISQIRSKKIGDNVLGLMTRKLETLQGKSREILNLSACIGYRFDPEILSRTAGLSGSETLHHLRPALEEGLILYENQKIIRFIDDGIRLTILRQLPAKFRKRTALDIGRFRLANLTPKETEENIFEITDYLNEGFKYIQDGDERIRLSELNLMAGRKAVKSTAYKTAVMYLSMGIGLLPRNKWEEHYQLTLNLYMESMEAEYLMTTFERAELLSGEILRHAEEIPEKLRVYRLRILLYTVRNQNMEALRMGWEALKLLGIDLEKIRETGEKEPYQELTGDPPIMEDPRQREIMRILMKITVPAHRTDPELLKGIILTMVRLSLKYGNAPQSAFAWVWYGILLCGKQGDNIDRGYGWGERAIKIIEEFNVREIRGKVLFLFNSRIRPWKEDFKEIVTSLEKVYQQGIEAGDLSCAYDSAVHSCLFLFCMGTPLSDILKKLLPYMAETERYRLNFHLNLGKIWAKILTHIRDGEKEDSYGASPTPEEENNLVLMFARYCGNTMLNYLGQNYEKAEEWGMKGEKYEKGGEGYIYLPLHYFYYVLSLIACYTPVSPDLQKEYMKKIYTIRDRFRIWAEHSPANFRHKLNIIEAEINRLAGNISASIKLYGKAIKEAEERGYIQDSALSYELQGEFYLELEREDLARFCLSMAYHRYKSWGAGMKTSLMERRFPHLSAETGRDSMINGLTAKTSESVSLPFLLDSTAIIRTSQIISQEIRLEHLLDKIMKIVIENAGAQKGILIENKDDKLIIRAKGEIREKKIVTSIINQQTIPMEESGELPLSVINYVAHARTSVVLNDALQDQIYSADPYIKLRHPRSLLCLPIIHQGKFLGILYLENSLTSNLFTGERLDILHVLSAQAAISLANANLYTNLENKIGELQRAEEELYRNQQELKRLNEELEMRVAQRTEDLIKINETLTKTLDELRQTQTQLVESEKMSALGSLVAGVAHEINTPVGIGVTAVSYLLEKVRFYEKLYKDNKLRKSNLDEFFKETNEGCSLALSNLERADKLIRNFKQVSVDQSSGERRCFSLNTYISEILTSLHHRLKQEKHRVVVKCHENIVLNSYPGAFYQIFTNLIINSLVHGFEEKKEGIITIDVILEKDRIFIYFSDNGRGIADENLKHIFEPFYTTRRDLGGTGLGLHIVYNLVTQTLGGRIKCESTPGEGTIFTMDFPMSKE